jgi:uncharacterized protein YegL
MFEHILPFYVACDESYSMADHFDKLNEDLRDLHREVLADPLVAGKVRFCLIGFSVAARVLIRLGQLDEVPEITCTASAAETNFGSVFDLLHQTIQDDLAQLQANRCTVYRPTVFFLSDGQPTDRATWPPAHARLTNPNWPARPNLVAFGIGDADPATINQIGTFRAFIAQNTLTPSAAIREFAKILTHSIIQAAESPSPKSDLLPTLPTHSPTFAAIQP